VFAPERKSSTGPNALTSRGDLRLKTGPGRTGRGRLPWCDRARPKMKAKVGTKELNDQPRAAAGSHRPPRRGAHDTRGDLRLAHRRLRHRRLEGRHGGDWKSL